MFGLNDILSRFDLGRVWFGSGRFQVNQFLAKYVRHTKTSDFVQSCGSGMVCFGSIRVLGPLSVEQISGVGSGYGSGSFGLGFGSRASFARSKHKYAVEVVD